MHSQLGSGKQGLAVPKWIWQLLVGIGTLAVGLTVLAWVLGRLRRHYQRPSVLLTGSGWTLEEVKRLHESGQLTDNQYERLRDEVAKGLKKEGYPKRPDR